MYVNLKSKKLFPNWPLAFEFLKRSPLHYLLTEQEPDMEDVPEELKRRIVLWGVPSNEEYITVPTYFDHDQVESICVGLATRHYESPDVYIGSIHGSNFIAFLHRFAAILKGKYQFAEVAKAITYKISELFDAEGASILIPNEDQSKFRFAYFHTQTDQVRDRLDGLEVPGDRGVTGWVAKHRKSLLVTEANKDQIFNPDIDRATSFQTRDIIATHVSLGDQLVAILQVVNKNNGTFQVSDLRTIELIASIIGVFMERAKNYDEKLQFTRVQRELEIAAGMQRQMMPKLPYRFGNFRLTGESLSASKVGGDFWDVLHLNENERMLIIGDVSGHGLGAAMIMSAVRTASHAIMPYINSPEAFVEPLNRLVHEEFGTNGHYATLIFCHINLTTRRIYYMRAGHEYPVLRTHEGEFHPLKESSGFPIGLLPFRRDDKWASFTLEPGQSLYFHTDGVLDGFDEEETTLVELLSKYPTLANHLEAGTFFSAMHKHLNWTDNDDATLLKLTFQDPSRE